MSSESYEGARTVIPAEPNPATCDVFARALIGSGCRS